MSVNHSAFSIERGWATFIHWLPRLVGVGLAFVLWALLAWMFPEDLMPYPIETLRLTFEFYVTGVAFTHLAPTMGRILLGFLGAMAVGIAIGVFMGTSNFGLKYFAPYIVMGLALPSVALAAIATLIFGFGFAAPVATAILAVFPFVAINVWKGVEDIDQSLLEMGHSFDISRRRMLRRIIIPNTAPALFAAVRFGLALSWKVVTVAEMFASSSGIGYVIVQTYQQTFFDQTWAWAIVFIIVIIVIEYLIFQPLEKRAFEYRQESDFDIVVTD